MTCPQCAVNGKTTKIERLGITMPETYEDLTANCAEYDAQEKIKQLTTYGTALEEKMSGLETYGTTLETKIDGLNGALKVYKDTLEKRLALLEKPQMRLAARLNSHQQHGSPASSPASAAGSLSSDQSGPALH